VRRFDFDSIDSTNTRAAALARAHPDAPIVVTAREQTAGRGRSGRPWRAPVGGAWFTLAWPTNAPATHTTAAPVLAGLAVVETLTSMMAAHAERRAIAPPGGEFRLKWPNDVLLNDRKVAGVLCEQALQAGAAARHILIGVGINVNVDPVALGDGLRVPATSLRESVGQAVDVTALIEDCATHIAALLDTMIGDALPGATVDRINRRLAWRGQTVTLQHSERKVTGVLHGIDPHGRARIGTGVFEAGEVAHVGRVG